MQYLISNAYPFPGKSCHEPLLQAQLRLWLGRVGRRGARPRGLAADQTDPERGQGRAVAVDAGALGVSTAEVHRAASTQQRGRSFPDLAEFLTGDQVTRRAAFNW